MTEANLMESGEGFHQCQEEAISISSDPIRTSTYGLLQDQRTNVQRTYKGRMKMLGSVILCVSLIAGSAGYIAVHNRNSSEVIRIPDEDSGPTYGSELKSPEHAFIMKSPRVKNDKDDNDKTPIALALRQGREASASENVGAPTTAHPRIDSSVVVLPSMPVEVASTSTNETRSRRNKKKNRINRHKELPINASSMHPVSLLYEMQNVLEPQFTFYECLQERTIRGFKAELTVINNVTDVFIGYGKKKKDAKRYAAEKACTRIWGFTYPFENIHGKSAIVDACNTNANLVILPGDRENADAT